MKVTFFLMLLLLVPQASGQQQVVEVPFDFVRNEIILQVKVDGKGPFNMMLDTGTDPSAIDLANRARVSMSVGYNNVSENREGKVSNVTIGGISVDEPSVVFFGKGAGRDKKPWGVNIGNAFLKDFVVTIDYRSKLVTLENRRLT